MLKIKEITIEGYEKVIEGTDEETGLHCYIAVHSTALGPSLGGTRIFPYESKEKALHDALRLAKAMTKKSALAESGFGGGKSVIIADPFREKTPELLASFAQAVNSLEGSYIAAEDVGSSVEDMAIVKKFTPYVAALVSQKSSGDPGPFTAWGVFMGIKATAMHLWGSASLKGKKIAVQGLGHVGSKLLEFLFWEGAELVIADIVPGRSDRFHALYDTRQVDPSEILSVPCDIFSPCAMGGILNRETIPLLHCRGIAGAANNQLLELSDGRLLFERGILYAPDFVINAGGIINASLEFAPGGYQAHVAREKTGKIYETLTDIYTQSQSEQKPTDSVAEEMAEYKIKNKIGRRTIPLDFSDDH